MPPLDLAIHGGTIVTATETRRADIGIADGRIVAIGEVGEALVEEDATGLLVLPGVVDPHTHLEAQFRADGPYTADDFLSGTEAAACGGVTTIIDYARQFPGMTLSDGIREWTARAAEKSLIDYSFHIIVTDFSDASLAEVPALLADGFPSVKAFMMRISDAELLKLMAASAAAGGLVMAHAENAAVLDHQKENLFAEGRRSARWYVDSRPEIGEAEATARAIDYADLTGATVCVVHLSCDAALQRVREAKARGSRPWIEVRPCYLLLDADRYTAEGVDPLTLSAAARRCGRPGTSRSSGPAWRTARSTWSAATTAPGRWRRSRSAPTISARSRTASRPWRRSCRRSGARASAPTASGWRAARRRTGWSR